LEPDGAAAFELWERSHLPPAWTAKNLPARQTQIVEARRIRRIDCYPVESEEDGAPETIAETENWLKLSGDLENPNDSEDD